MAPTVACKFGGKCNRADCTFSHPAWVACGKFGEKRCREKSACANPKCGFSHPADWVHVQNKPGSDLLPWLEGSKFGDKRCRDAGGCTNAKCGFAHPADWVHNPGRAQGSLQPESWAVCGKFGERRCRDGAACRNATCGFSHPRDWVHFHGTMLDVGQEEQIVAGMGQLGLEQPATLHEEKAVSTVDPPPFIATNFTTRAAYDAWLQSGANPKGLPAAP